MNNKYTVQYESSLKKGYWITCKDGSQEYFASMKDAFVFADGLKKSYPSYISRKFRIMHEIHIVEYTEV